MNRLEKLKSFTGITKIGLVSNLMFVLFIIVTLLYYSYYMRTGNIVRVVEVIAYAIEVAGFVLMATAAVGFCVQLRDRKVLKTAVSLYFLTEFILMICDFNLIDVSEFYTPASKVLIITHCVFSAAVVMSYIQIDPDSKQNQTAAAVSSVICMLGTFSIVFDVRVYASVLVNSVAYIVLYSLLLFYSSRELIHADCYGDENIDYSNISTFDDSYNDNRK